MIALTRLASVRRVPDASAVVTYGVLALAVGYAAAILGRGDDGMMLVPLLLALVFVAVFALPAVGVYLVFGAVILFEQFTILGLHPITADTHFYQNPSAFTDIPIRLSATDLLLLLTLAAWGARVLIGRAPRPIGVPFGWAAGGYVDVCPHGRVIE